MANVRFIVLRLRAILIAGCVIIALVAACVFSAWGRGSGDQPGALTDIVVAVDAGHGGEDRGVCHVPADLIEKEINLDMANRVGARLASQGAQVIQIRSEDTFIELDQRSQFANQVKADLLVSLHVNRIPGHPECFGAQTFYFPGREASQRLATLLQEALLAIDPANYRSALFGEYRILRLADMPAAIVEIGFMTNERDRGLLATSDYRDRVADAVVSGIVRFATLYPGDIGSQSVRP